MSKGRPDACAVALIPTPNRATLLSALVCVTHPVEITLEYSLPVTAYMETAETFLPIQNTSQILSLLSIVPSLLPYLHPQLPNLISLFPLL